MKRRLSATLVVLCLIMALPPVAAADDPTDNPTDGPEIAVTDVTLNKTSTTIEAGKTEALAVTVVPSNATDKSVAWSSSNTDVATVSDSGVVTAIIEGTAVITVTTADGSYTATCAVTVTASSGSNTGTAADTYAIRIAPWIWRGEVYTSHRYAEPGTWVTVTVYPDIDYEVDWVDVERDDTGRYLSLSRSGRRYSFVMPASDVTVYADFSLDVNTYEVWVAPGILHGDVYTSRTFAEPGTRVTITVDPDSYYVLDWIRAERDDTGRSLSLNRSGNRYTFTMPYSSVFIDAGFSSGTARDIYITYQSQTTAQSITQTIRPTSTQTIAQASTYAPSPAYTQTASTGFTDVQPGTYCYDAVTWTVGNRIASGYSDGTFRPEAACTRADFVTYLWHAGGSRTASSRINPFVDIDPNAYYYEAVLWALENGITSGNSTNTFDPNGACTRAQIITFLWRAHDRPAVGSGTAFSDVPGDSYYANPVAWATAKGIASGTTATTFEPDAICTRGQCVTFLYRVLTGQ